MNNNVKELHDKYAENRKLILRHVLISEDKLSELIFKMGISYLERMLQGDPVGYQILAYSKAFWEWWKNQWHRIDYAFVDWYLAPVQLKDSNATPAQLALWYINAHNPDKLPTYPGNIVFKLAKKELQTYESSK
jgi:hypothetical protein